MSKPSIVLLFIIVCGSPFVLQKLAATQQLTPGPSSSSSTNTYLIDAIEIEFDGIKNVSEEFILSHILLRNGKPYSQSLIDRSIRSLYNTGFFQLIETRLQPLDAQRVKLIFTFKSKYRVQEIVFEGNQRISERKLRKKIELKQGEVLDELQINRDLETLREYYHKKGFSQAELDYTIERNDTLGLGRVIYEIDEGTKALITKIQFTGNQSVKSRKLLKVIETRKRNLLFGWLTGSGRFKEDILSEDIDRVRDYYRDLGFLDVEVSDTETIIEYPDDDRIEIAIPIKEGHRYSIGDISISGNQLFQPQSLLENIQLEKGDDFSPSKVAAAAEAIRDYYGARGYLETKVRAKRIPNLRTSDIGIEFIVAESDQYRVGSVKITGNDKTKSTVILRELALAPGDIFDLVRMKNSRNRLLNTRFFEEVNLSPEPTDIPGRSNLRVAVKEARTGNLTFGAGFSSLERAVFFVELTQSNFDLSNYRSFFQGDGQKFRLRLQIGSSSNQFLLAFEEPWLFERELAAGVELFRTETEYNSSVYDELRFGTEFYLRKRLFELVEGRAFYRIEHVRIFNVDDAEATPTILDAEGSQSISKVGVALTRDTRDNLLMTTSGSRVRLATEVAGGPFAAGTDYWRLEAKGARFWPISDLGDQVLSLIGRAGTVAAFSGDNVPFFDRYYLGGPNSLRGFDFREVSPHERAADGDDEPIGGDSFGFFSIEYSLVLVEPLRFAIFYDWGFVNSSDFDFDPSGYNDNWGIGLRLLVLGSPLRLDLAFPINSEDYNDQTSQFYFSFGTRF